MSPVSGKTEKTGAVYVLYRYIGGRRVVPTPHTNAERPDTDFFYAEGVYDAYPDRKEHLERRRDAERRGTAKVQAWAYSALDALDDGAPLPYTAREVLAEVFDFLVKSGPAGATRQEICRTFGRDGGKVSAALTDLHASQIIYPLEGVRR